MPGAAARRADGAALGADVGPHGSEAASGQRTMTIPAFFAGAGFTSCFVMLGTFDRGRGALQSENSLARSGILP